MEPITTTRPAPLADIGIGESRGALRGESKPFRSRLLSLIVTLALIFLALRTLLHAPIGG